MLTLPDAVQIAVEPLLRVLPLERAMRRLVGGGGVSAECLRLTEQACAAPALSQRPELQAGLWLYVDELERSHAISQNIQSPTGAFWHAIMHRREGDFFNSKYWYRRAGNHPAMNRISIAGGSAGAGTELADYEPLAFVDSVAAAQTDNQPHSELIAFQHREWIALFEWCAERL